MKGGHYSLVNNVWGTLFTRGHEYCPGDMKGGNAVHCDTGLLSFKLVIGGYDSVAIKGQNTKLSVFYDQGCYCSG